MASPIASRVATHVHIKVSPALQSLGQSKQVLSALQKFGDVHTFRNLKYDVKNDSREPNRPILAIFDSPEAAQRAIASSPITVTLAPTSLQTRKIDAGDTSREAGETTTVECVVGPSRHNHASSMKRNPFYTTYNLFKSSPIYDDMMQAETGVPLKELADVLQSKKYYITAGVRDKIQEHNRRLGAGSLMELWEEGMESDVVEELQIGGAGGGGDRGAEKRQLDANDVK